MKTKEFIKQNYIKILVLICVGLISFAIPIIILSSINSKKAEASNWYNDHWQYRQKLIIDNSGVEQTDKYVTVTANTSDTTKFQADCGDIRFTKGNGEVLPYYIVSGCGTASTVIHINFDVIQVGDNLNYIYYGNESAENGFESSDFTNGEAATYTPTLNSTVENSPGPVAYWSFDEGQGQVANDLTGNGNDGQLGSTTGIDASDPTWISEDMCISGKCLEFDGSDDSVRFGDINDLDKQFTEFSFSSWVKPNQITGNPRYITGKMGASGQRGWQFGILTDYKIELLYFDTSNGSSQRITTDTSIPINRWSHVGFVYKSSDYVEIYINGQLAKKLDAGVHPTFNGSNSAYFQIGNRGDSIGTQFFPGFIDEPKIYPYARSAEEIKSDYIKGASKNGSTAVLGVQDTGYLNDGLVGYWKMDEASWNGTAGEVKDSSGNGNDGTSANGALTSVGKYGNGANFDGNSNISIPDSPTWDTGDSITVAHWMRTDVNQIGAGLVVHDISSYKYLTYLSSDSQTLSFYSVTMSGNTQVTCSGAFADNVWHHVVGIYDRNSSNGKRVKIYVDGILCDAKTGYDEPILSGDEGINLGKWKTSSGEFVGELDEVRIYDRALSSSEVSDLYNWTPGPVAHWKMDDAVSGDAQTVVDSSGNGLNGTTSDVNGSGMDCTVPGKIGKGCEFDGVDDKIIIPDSEVLQPFGDFSISAWINKTDCSTYNRIVSKWDGGSNGIDNGGFAFDTNETQSGSGEGCGLRFFIYDSNDSPQVTNASGQLYSEKEWHHVTATLRDGIIKTYLDGMETSSTSLGETTIEDSSFDWGIGEDYYGLAGNENFNGQIDDVRIYNYARTPEQILQDMRGNNVSSESQRLPEPIAYWGFDEGYGVKTNYVGLIEGEGALAYDNGSGTLPLWSKGRVHKSLTFNNPDGQFGSYVVNDIINIPSEYGKEITISAWINPDIQTAPVLGTIIRNGLTYDENYGLFININTLNPIFGIYDGSNFRHVECSNCNIEINQWSNISVIFNQGNYVEFYVDGQFEKKFDFPYISVQSSSNTSIGGHNGAHQGFEGKIDEVKIYNTALTPDQVKQDYNLGAATNFSSGTDEKEMVTGVSSSTSGPIAYWNFDENSGTGADAVHDISGNNNHGTMEASMTESDWVPGNKGSAMSFDGVDDYIIISNPSEDDFGTGAMSVSTWFKTSGASGVHQIIIDNKHSGTHNAGFNLQFLPDNQLYFRLANGSEQNGALIDGTSWQDGDWHHAVGVLERGDDYAYLYVDGQLVDSTNLPDGWDITSSVDLYIGKSTANISHFIGSLDEVKIYDYALSPSQIAYEYNRGGPVAWYKLDECQGNTAFDSSGNENHGTLNIGATGTNTSGGTCESGVGSEAWNNGAEGKLNSSLDFDGVDDEVNLGDPINGIFDFGTGDFSLALWARKDSVSTQWESLLSKVNTTTNNGWDLRLTTTGLPQILLDDTDGRTATIEIDDGEWHHIAVARAGTTIKIYIDGNLNNTKTISLFDVSGSEEVVIGNRYAASGAYYDGQIDDVRIYNYALSDEQIMQVMNGGAGVRFE